MPTRICEADANKANKKSSGKSLFILVFVCGGGNKFFDRGLALHRPFKKRLLGTVKK
jgi:hypothetical protein